MTSGGATTKSYRSKTWLDPRIRVGQSRLSGGGLFAAALIKKDEVVVVFGGAVFSSVDVEAGKAKRRSLLMIGEDLWLGDRPEDPDHLDRFLNHSCDPNLWFRDEVTMVARRNIAPGEEVTLDYSMHFGNPNWTMKERCRCGSSNCRGVITGKDWMLENLQKRYSGHFSFLERANSPTSPRTKSELLVSQDMLFNLISRAVCE